MSSRRISQRSQRNLSQKVAPVKVANYFTDVLEKIKISLKYDESPNVYEKEQSILIRDLQKELERHIDYPNNIQEFMKGLKEFVKKPALFKKALLPSELQKENDDEVVSRVQQDSLFRLFLNVDRLQHSVVKLIMEELTTHAIEDEDDTIWVRLLLGTLRYLSYLKDAEKLSTKLLEILEVATYPSQLEILTFIPDIIPDSEYDNTARHLSKILNENTKLAGAIIDCLNYLNLKVETKTEIQDRILSILKTTSCTKIFPTIFHFLITDCKPDNLNNILMKTREALDGLILRSANKDGASSQFMSFDEIREIAITSKIVSESWINLISGFRSASDHKGVDVILLLMLHSVGGNKKHAVETLIKKKIKTRQFKTSLFETTLKKCLAPQLLNDYIKSIINIATCLLRTHFDDFYTEFAKIMFVTTFGHPHAEKQHRQQLLNSLILLTGSTDGKRNIPALGILNLIAEQHLDLMKPHTMQLTALLDKLEDINLKEVQQMFDILCLLIFGAQADETDNIFQNDIHMLVRKQLSSSKKSIKYRGIISAVTAAKHIANVADEDDESLDGDESYNSVSDLPNGPAKQAAMLLELANTSTQICPIAQGLYYDQLAYMLTVSQHLDKHFMGWLFDVITNDFQRIYVSDNAPAPINDIDLKIIYNINSDAETGDSPIAINVAELTINAKQNNNIMLTFAPLFRLLRLIHFKQNAGKLESIDALLGCGVILPELDPDLGIEKFDTEQANQVIDCLYHCINWFREIISAFVKQEDAIVQKKILRRLKNLVELEGIFVGYMKFYPDHKLPLSDFFNLNMGTTTSVPAERSKTGESSKRKRTTNLNKTKATQATQAQAAKPRRTFNKDPPEMSFHFREMDTDVLTLLQYRLETEETDTEANYLNLAEFKFIMKDLVQKLHTFTKTGSATFTHLTVVKPENFVTDCVRLMPYINQHLITIADETKQILSRNDGIVDAHELFLEKAGDLKIAFGLVLEVLALVFNWSGFQDPKRLPLLRECLKALVDDEHSQLNSAQRLILEFCKCLMRMIDICLTLSAAVHLVNIMKALCSLSPDDKPQRNLIWLAGKLLGMKWYAVSGLPETGAAANVNIDILVKAHLSGSSVLTISNIVSWVQHESEALLSKENCLMTFPQIKKQNFPILFRGMCTYLVEALSSELTGLTNKEHLTLWFNVATTMRNLMAIVKIQDSRSNLSAFLKRMIQILKIFLSHGLPILEIMLKTQTDRTIEILRMLQQTTRFIHNLCCHTKLSKDKALIAYVPQMRLTLETLVYRVKAALTANDCSAAFWMGNLKNKNLKGEEILSQSTQNDSEERPSDEELPPEGDSDHETQSVAEESASEIF